MLSAIGSFFSMIWPYLVALLCFMFLIVAHEFGHFIAAKAMGVRVNEFSIGFGPKLFSIKGKETTYLFKPILLGGYCAMEGESEDSDSDRAFCNKKPWRHIQSYFGACNCGYYAGTGQCICHHDGGRI